MAAPLPRMSLVTIQAVGVRLDNAAVFEKQESGLFGGHAGSEGFGLIESNTQTGEDAGWIDGFRRYERLPVGG